MRYPAVLWGFGLRRGEESRPMGALDWRSAGRYLWWVVVVFTGVRACVCVRA